MNSSGMYDTHIMRCVIINDCFCSQNIFRSIKHILLLMVRDQNEVGSFGILMKIEKYCKQVWVIMPYKIPAHLLSSWHDSRTSQPVST